MRQVRVSGRGATTEPLERRALFAAGALDVATSRAGAHAVSFVDADGTSVAVSLNGGDATLHFAGDSLAAAAAPGHSTDVTGSAVSLRTLSVTGTSPGASLVIRASGGDGRVTLASIIADGPLKTIDAPQLVLTGSLATAGPVRQLRMLRTEHATLTLGGGAGTSSVEISDAAVNTDMSSAAPISRLTLGAWGGPDITEVTGAPEGIRLRIEPGGTISAPFIGKAVVAGTFAGGINTSSAGSLDFQLVRDTLIVVTGDVRSASFVALQDSSVYVGVRQLPVVPSNYRAASSIGSLRVGAYDPFLLTHSLVAAPFIGRIFIGNLLNDFAYEDRDFIFADRINHLTVKAHTTHVFYTVHRNHMDGTSVHFAMLLIQAM